MIDGKDELFGTQLFKSLLITALAVIIYHVVFKKFANAKLKNIQSTCSGKDIQHKDTQLDEPSELN
jgi:hypothetical protein